VSAATAPVPQLPTLRDAIEHPLETLAALLGRSNAAWIQAKIASSLLHSAPSGTTPLEALQTPPRLPAWHRCTPEQKKELRRQKRSQARPYHWSKPLSGLKAEDRIHEARTARTKALGDDLRRASEREEWWRPVQGSRYVTNLDTT